MSADRKKAAIDIFQLCFENRAWKTQNDQIVVLSRRHGQLKQWYVLLGWLSPRCHWLNQVYGLMKSRSGNGQARHWMRETRLLNGSLTSSGNLAAWCALMKVPTINQEDAAIGSQPRKTMMSFDLPKPWN
ncbi:hypothetical protein HanIR_Chr01g0004691 [Helianthus annuus]|nr:hypothetical protein HanIR_Chr01g0004691 [Helianthus annuus]KAJ0625635.1 hypothetical protein HanHA89_Chr01g0003821 [Helianthus annuus]KAJ0782009.1 hypothetical protein HanLR1_Chr01g0003221 [Helianthus annuus]